MSEYKLNFSKTEVLPLNSLCYQYMFSDTNFKWCPSKLKYLGIWFSPTIPQTLSHNLNALKLKIQNLLTSWSPLFLSWWGRLDTIKMMIVSLILFLLSMLPFQIPNYYFNQINSLCTKFIWCNKPARIALFKLIKPKNEGGTIP